MAANRKHTFIPFTCFSADVKKQSGKEVTEYMYAETK